MRTLENLIEEISRCEQTLSQWDNSQKEIVERLKGVEQAIKTCCPEITKVLSVNNYAIVSNK